MTYYPETSVIMGLARIQRIRQLPRFAVPKPAPVNIIENNQVEAVTTVLMGNVLREYRILDVAQHLKIRRPKPDKVAAMINVNEGQWTLFGQELARRGPGRRAPVLLSPAEGRVIRVEDGKIIIQLSEREIEIQARIQGIIDEVEPHRVKLSGNGAVLQCAWGNGAFRYEVYKFLPEDGFVGLSRLEVSISEYRNVVIISPLPLTKGDLLVAQQQEVAGVVAPSMPANLREFAMGLKFPVLLTEGFGQRRPTTLIYSLLQDNIGRQAAFDASTPDRWTGERPEILIPLPAGGLPPTPALDQALWVSARVRILRAPWDGLIGEVVELPATPQRMDNGLRLLCARVRLSSEQVVLVPLANLELLGPPADMPN